jgi:hypothetical protein
MFFFGLLVAGGGMIKYAMTVIAKDMIATRWKIHFQDAYCVTTPPY